MNIALCREVMKMAGGAREECCRLSRMLTQPWLSLHPPNSWPAEWVMADDHRELTLRDGEEEEEARVPKAKPKRRSRKRTAAPAEEAAGEPPQPLAAGRARRTNAGKPRRRAEYETVSEEEEEDWAGSDEDD